MKKLFVFLASLVMLVLMSVAQAQAADLKPFKGATPELKLSGLDGKNYDLNDYKGKVVLVQFWATYCGPCREEMPSMNKLLKKLGNKGFDILAVDMGETEPEVETFVNQVKPDFTILLDPEGKAIGDWNAFAVPANFLIDKTGQIRYTLFGGTDWGSPQIAKVINQLLAE